MTCSEEVAHIFEKAKALLDAKEKEYGNAWRLSGTDVCITQIFRKANYVRVQWENDRTTTEKFMEDLLDLINWCILSYHLVGGNNEAGTREPD